MPTCHCFVATLLQRQGGEAGDASGQKTSPATEQADTQSSGTWRYWTGSPERGSLPGQAVIAGGPETGSPLKGAMLSGFMERAVRTRPVQRRMPVRDLPGTRRLGERIGRRVANQHLEDRDIIHGR